MVSNPNAGKTTLFNCLTGLRAKTANFPGTTIELRVARRRFGEASVELIDMPGLYSLSGVTAEEKLALQELIGRPGGRHRPDALILLLDATNLERNLYLASQVLELGLPVLVALNMIDLADREGIEIDAEALGRELGCEVVPLAARTGKGYRRFLERLTRFIARLDEIGPPKIPEMLADCARREESHRYDWAEQVAAACQRRPPINERTATQRIDRVLTHPVVGVAAFFAVMMSLFYLIFSLATVPMDLIDGVFAALGAGVGGLIGPEGLRSLVVDGIIGGVGGVLVFLPQICILFFFLTLLEDTGYMARAAFVMDRLMGRFGLPGKAFVPMIAAHACALPAIMASRVIENRRDRLVTILVIPLMTCSARLPIYAMVTAMLFPSDPLRGAVIFSLAYALGLLAALSMAFIFQRTILPGRTKPLVIELPSYKMPGLKTALLATYDRVRIFVRKAGTTILALSIILWWSLSYPKLDAAALPEAAAAAIATLESEATASEAAGDAESARATRAEIDSRVAQEGLAYSWAGRLGRGLEPLFAPLGFDWKIGVGVLASFAAREVIVSALSVVYGVGEQDTEEGGALLQRMSAARRPDGTPVFTFATCVSLLIFYVLAMQCLPTQIVTRRETGEWKWAAFQLLYMTALAWSASFVAYQSIVALGWDRLL